MESPKDQSGNAVHVGSRVRLVRLSWRWLNDLSTNEKAEVLSMVGEIFEVEEIDDPGRPVITKWWYTKANESHSHSISLDPPEIQLVSEPTS